MQIWSAEIKEIDKLLESFKGQIPELGKELDQLIKSDDPNVLMLYSRRCLEVIMNLCEQEFKRPQMTLGGIIDKLNKRKGPSYRTSMHGLVTFRHCAHPEGFRSNR
jgi:hypothetical protein